MTDSSSNAPQGCARLFALHLLDPNLGHPLIKWRFVAQPIVRIGRSEQNQIAITDPSVSRKHAELHWQEDHWKLVNLGRNGTLIDGAAVSDVPLKHGVRFRLGPLGPTLQLTTADASSLVLGTVDGAPPETPCIEIDHSQKERQVSAITGSAYFQQLQQMASQLKHRTGKVETLPE